MKPLTPRDVLDLVAYERVRDEFRRRTIEIKNARRLAVGELVTFVFENRDTLLFQVQEIVRAERIVAEQAVQDELDVYNELMPGGSELSATCFIEVTEKERIKEVLDGFLGLDAPGAVRLRLGNGRDIAATFEQGRSEGDRISAVHYVRFAFEPRDIAWWKAGAEGSAPPAREYGADCAAPPAREHGADCAVLAIDLPGYRREAVVPPEVRASLARDLG